jgi:CelD/BcsL family acetyltransferase involved in cellulose biosynthesis
VEWLTDPVNIEALKSDWTGFEATVRDRTVYGTFDYVTSWYRGYCGTECTGFGTPLVGVVRDRDALVCLAPLIACNSTLARVPIRRLDLAGYTLQAGELLVAADRDDALAALLSSLADRSDWDMLVLGNLIAERERATALRHAAARLGLGLEVTDDYSYAVADLHDGYETYAKRQGSNFRKQTRRHAKKVEQSGLWRIDRLAGWPTAARVQEYLGRMFAVADAGWRARERGLAEERKHHPFYRIVVDRFVGRGMVDLSILQMAGRDAAFTLGLVERGVYFHTLVAFDEDLAAYSPGSFLLQEVFRLLPTLDVHTVVSHGDYEYKRRWATDIVAQQRLLLFSRTLRAHSSHFAKFRLQPLWERLRAARWSPPVPRALTSQHAFANN